MHMCLCVDCVHVCGVSVCLTPSQRGRRDEAALTRTVDMGAGLTSGKRPGQHFWGHTAGGLLASACDPDPAAGLLGCCFPRPALGDLGAKSGPRSRRSTPERTDHLSQVPALEKGSPRTEGEGSGWRGGCRPGLEAQQGTLAGGPGRAGHHEVQRGQGPGPQPGAGSSWAPTRRQR